MHKLKNMQVDYVGSEMNKMQLMKNEQGTTLIEFALVLTLLLTLTFGMIDFSRYIYTISVVRSAAQEGARAGVVNVATAQSAAESKMVALDVARSNITVQRPNAETVEVEVSYQFEFITPFLATLVSNNAIEVNGSASMTIY
ncbi:MAG: pilus assembly protein [Caldilineaceae bacterium]|nr:pilus assembly protein [Caldilineaceae bacterium]